MAMWRRDLVKLGGFARVGAVLAEDHMLGRLFLDAGHGVRTSLDVVENRNVGCSVRRSMERHTRWAKMRRALSPTSFVFEPLLTPLVVATIVAIVVWSWATPAYAYIDPTAAGAALQSLYIVVASALMTLALIPQKLATGFARFKSWLRSGAAPPSDRDG